MKDVLKLALEAYLCREMPAGTVIGDPKWWAPKIAAAIKEALAQQEQEPDDMTIAYMNGFYDGKKKRPWVGLTFAEICGCEHEYEHKFARNIEAKLKEKNT